LWFDFLQEQDFSCLQCVLTGSGAHSTAFWVGTKDYFSGGKVASGEKFIILLINFVNMCWKERHLRLGSEFNFYMFFLLLSAYLYCKWCVGNYICKSDRNLALSCISVYMLY
jgi:hypothetical protein